MKTASGGLFRRLSSRLGLAVSLICMALCAQVVHAQQLALFPSCGKVGDSINVCGSGWAEPDPVCEYIFILNGAEVAPRQPDGLYGPPNTSFTVPNVAAGTYELLVELRLTGKETTLIQSKTTPFKVVDATQQPLSGATSDGGSAITITYDPSKACKGECSKIYFIQSRNTRRILDDGTDEHLPYNEEPHNWPNGDQIEEWFVNDVAIDRIYGKAFPYYGIPPGAATVGSTAGGAGGAAVNADMSDQPQRSDDVYAADVKTIKIIFDVNCFCGEGDAAGTWLGNFTWEWSRDKGAASTKGTVTLGSATDTQPSAAFLASLDKWIEKNPGFVLPTTNYPGCN